MKLLTFAYEGGIRLAATQNINGRDLVFDLNRLDNRIPDDIVVFLEGGPDTLDLTRNVLNKAKPAEGIDLRSVELKAPLVRPGKIICIGQNYLEHAHESGAGKASFPIIFAKYTNSIIGPGQAIVIPAVVKKPDYEGELGVVIGRKGRNIPEETALDYVGGYTILNDVSARDWQNRTSQWVIGKTCDTFCPIGPVLVTADEIPDPQALHLRTIISGEIMQQGFTGDMIFPVVNLIADMSQVMTLEPGDIIATGTPPGVGFARKPPRWLRPGDLVRIEIEGIGALENPVEFENLP
jgi:acylpyruvate hydrolase